MSAMPWLQPLERGDRWVERLHLRLPDGESQSRVSFAIEEALRLMALPGEEQGRAYYFRRVPLLTLPAAAPRSLWQDSCQKSLRTLAERAIHGRDSRAAGADAVFFLTQLEALEWFLGRLLVAARSAAPSSPVTLPWFAPMISGVSPDESVTAHFIGVIERLRRLPSGWFTAAAAVFSVLPESLSGVAAVLVSVPVTQAGAWLQEFGWLGLQAGAMAQLSPGLSFGKRDILRRVIALAGLKAGSRSLLSGDSHQPASLPPDSRLLWLTVLAIAAEQPPALDRGTAMASAQAILATLQQPAMFPPRDVDTSDAGRLLVAPADHKALPGTLINAFGEPDLAIVSRIDPSRATEAAGLYFLLHALRQIGIATALDTVPDLDGYKFLPRLMLTLAQHVGVLAGDPALEWAYLELKTAEPVPHPVQASLCWPRNLPPAPAGFSITATDLLRVWKLAVRRWCWRLAGLTLREIICRPGRILLARADLDVTLLLESAELRIRRVGLDLDPGWLPWFGRVVRFHYVRHWSDGGDL